MQAGKGAQPGGRGPEGSVEGRPLDWAGGEV